MTELTGTPNNIKRCYKIVCVIRLRDIVTFLIGYTQRTMKSGNMSLLQKLRYAYNITLKPS